jgi:hypothetical protein
MSHKAAVSRLLIFFLISIFLTTSAAVSPAQSGRRPRKPSTAAIEAPESPTSEVAPVTKPEPSLLLSVGVDQNGGFANFPLYFYADTLSTVIERLGQDASVKVIDAGNISRGDAVKSAKAEKEGYMIHLQLKLETMDSDGYSENAKNVVVEYWVFAPATAKIATSGHTYPRDYQNKGIIMRPNSSRTYNEFLLDLAAKAAADQILGYFKKQRPANTRLPSPFGW